MADSQDVFYKPDIRPPEREVKGATGSDTERDYQNDRRRVSDEMGIPADDIPIDAFDAMINRFKYLELQAVELRRRSIFLLDRTIEDLDSYVGDFPPVILRYIEELTGRTFTYIDYGDAGDDESG